MTTAWRNRIVGSGEESPDQLVANPLNWRTHPGSQRDALRGSLSEVGWVQQVLVNKRTGNVVDGHARVEEALSRHEAMVPVLYVDLEPEEERLVLASLDPIGAMAQRDDERLTALLADLHVDDAGLQALLDSLSPDDPKAGLTDPDDVPDLGEETHIKRGDLFALGDHRLMCGDATDPGDVGRLMDGVEPLLVFTSPPYNVGKDYGAHDDSMDSVSYWRMIDAVLLRAFETIAPGAALMWNVGVSPKSRPFDHAAAIERAGFWWLRQIVWRKVGAAIPIWQNTVRTRRARHYMPNYTHEVVYLGSKGELAIGGPITPDATFQHDVWELGQFSAGGHNHPAAFPVALPSAGIVHMTTSGEGVYDPFLGSGTTIIAAEQLNRRCYAMEIDPRYVAVAIKRWEDFTGRTSERIDG